MNQIEKLLQHFSVNLKSLDEIYSKNTSNTKNFSMFFKKNNNNTVPIINLNASSIAQNQNNSKEQSFSQTLKKMTKLNKQILNLIKCSEETKNTAKYSQQLNKKMNCQFKWAAKLIKKYQYRNPNIIQLLQKMAQDNVQVIFLFLLKFKGLDHYKKEDAIITEVIDCYLYAFNSRAQKKQEYSNHSALLGSFKQNGLISIKQNLKGSQTKKQIILSTLQTKQNVNALNMKFSIPYLASRVHMQFIDSSQQILLWYVSNLLLSDLITPKQFSLVEVYLQEVFKMAVKKGYMQLLNLLIEEGLNKVQLTANNSKIIQIGKYYSIFSQQMSVSIINIQKNEQAIKLIQSFPKISNSFGVFLYCQVIEKVSKSCENVQFIFFILKKIEIYLMSQEHQLIPPCKIRNEQAKQNAQKMIRVFSKLTYCSFLSLSRLKKLLKQGTQDRSQYHRCIQTIRNINQILLNYLSFVSKKLLHSANDSKKAVIIIQQYISIIISAQQDFWSSLVGQSMQNNKRTNFIVVTELIYANLEQIKRFFALAYSLVIQVNHLHHNLKTHHPNNQYTNLINNLKQYISWTLLIPPSILSNKTQARDLRAGFLQILAYFSIPKLSNLQSPLNTLMAPHLQSSLLIPYFYKKFNLTVDQKVILLKIVGKITNEMVNTDIQYLTGSKHSANQKLLFKKVRKQVILQSFHWIKKQLKVNENLCPPPTTSIKIILTKQNQHNESAQLDAESQEETFPISPSSQNFQKSLQNKGGVSKHTQSHIEAVIKLLQQNLEKIQKVKNSLPPQSKITYRNETLESYDNRIKNSYVENSGIFKKIFHQIDYPLRLLPQTIEKYSQLFSFQQQQKIIIVLKKYGSSGIQQFCQKASRIVCRWLEIVIQDLNHLKNQKINDSNQENFSCWKYFKGKQLNTTIRQIFKIKGQQYQFLFQKTRLNIVVSLIDLLKFKETELTQNLNCCQAIRSILLKSQNNLSKQNKKQFRDIIMRIFTLLFQRQQSFSSVKLQKRNQLPQVCVVRHSPNLWFDIINKIIELNRKIGAMENQQKIDCKEINQQLFRHSLNLLHYFAFEQQNNDISVIISKRLSKFFQISENKCSLVKGNAQAFMNTYIKTLQKVLICQNVAKDMETPCFRLQSSNINTRKDAKFSQIECTLKSYQGDQNQNKYQMTQFIYERDLDQLDVGGSLIKQTSEDIISDSRKQSLLLCQILQNFSLIIVQLYSDKNFISQCQQKRILDQMIVDTVRIMLSKNLHGLSGNLIQIIPFCSKKIDNSTTKHIIQIKSTLEDLFQQDSKSPKDQRQDIFAFLNGVSCLLANFNNFSLGKDCQDLFIELVQIAQNAIEFTIAQFAMIRIGMQNNKFRNQFSLKFIEGLFKQYQKLLDNVNLQYNTQSLQRVASQVYSRIPVIVNMAEQISPLQIGNNVIELYVRIVEKSSNFLIKQGQNVKINNFSKQEDTQNMVENSNILIFPPMRYHVLKLILYSPKLIPNRVEYYIKIYEKILIKQKQVNCSNESNLLSRNAQFLNIESLLLHTMKNQTDSQNIFRLLSYFLQINVIQNFCKPQLYQDSVKKCCLFLPSNVIPTLCLTLLRQKSEMIAESQKLRIELSQNSADSSENIFIQIEKAITMMNELIEKLIASQFILFNQNPDFYDKFLQICNEIMKQAIQLVLVQKLQINRKIQALLKRIIKIQNQRFLIESILQQ